MSAPTPWQEGWVPKGWVRGDQLTVEMPISCRYGGRIFHGPLGDLTRRIEGDDIAMITFDCHNKAERQAVNDWLRWWFAETESDL